ncbi:hypothetical protein BDY19DRAFT_247885 [Irpex rosettiformis]|uniref:Uncharacterized protein n=1 Tax=Irpex rosettiformis TaxID=378272 RepID=A0ACB8TZ41_9APHY|nr:hypothetical protein BDY19DRAFT_247885 [Irpex rosettiformis]
MGGSGGTKRAKASTQKVFRLQFQAPHTPQKRGSLKTTKEPTSVQEQRWPHQIPKHMTFTLRLDPTSPIIGPKAPKDNRHVSQGPLEMYENNFQVSLPPLGPPDKDQDEDTPHPRSTVSEDASDLPDPSTPEDVQFDPSIPFPGIVLDSTSLGSWQTNGQADAMLFLNPTHYPYSSFLPEYPPNLTVPGSFGFESCSSGFASSQSLLSDSGLSCPFPFSNSRHDFGSGLIVLEGRQHSVDSTLGVMDTTSFNIKSTDLSNGLQEALPAENSTGDSSSIQQDNEHGIPICRQTAEPGHVHTAAPNTLVRPSRRSRQDEPDLSESSGTRTGSRQKSNKKRRNAPKESTTNSSRPPLLPTLPSLPSIFPPEWYGSNVLEGRVAAEQSRHYVPIRPAVSVHEPTPPPASFINHSNNTILSYPPMFYPHVVHERPNSQIPFPPASVASIHDNSTLRPAAWSMPPLAEPRHCLDSNQPTPPYTQGPGYFSLPSIEQFSFMSGIAPFQLEPPSGDSWTEHFDFLQDELHERKRLQRIQDRFNRLNNISQKPPAKRRPLSHPCPLCERSFMRRNSLALHLKWHYTPYEGKYVYHVYVLYMRDVLFRVGPGQHERNRSFHGG